MPTHPLPVSNLQNYLQHGRRGPIGPPGGGPGGGPPPIPPPIVEPNTEELSLDVKEDLAADDNWNNSGGGGPGAGGPEHSDPELSQSGGSDYEINQEMYQEEEGSQVNSFVVVCTTSDELLYERTEFRLVYLFRIDFFKKIQFALEGLSVRPIPRI